MGRYHPLTEFLKAREDDIWSASFAQVEKILGFSLPESAEKYPAWWANQSNGRHSQAMAWQEAGWRTRNVDLRGRRVAFERSRPKAKLAREEGEDALFARAAEYTGIAERSELVREAMKALIEREAAKRLARLGGSMTDFEAPPRRRGAGA